MKLKKLSGGWKILLIIASILLVLTLSANFFIANYLKKKIDEFALQNSGKGYRLELKKLTVNIFTGSASLHGIRVYSEGNDSIESMDLRARSLKISGIGLIALLRQESICLNKIHLEHPTILIKNMGLAKKKGSIPKNFTVYDLISPWYNAVTIHKVIVSNGSIHAAKKDTGAFSVSCPSVQFELDDVLVDSTTASRAEIFAFKNASFTLKNINALFSEGLYKMNVTQTKFNLKDSLFSIDSLFISPAIDKKAFAKKRGYQDDCFSIILAGVQFHSHQFDEFIYHQNIFLDSIEIRYAKVSAYRDKNIPRKLEVKKLPQQALDSLHFKLDVRKFKLGLADMFYEELTEGSPESGQISFNKVSAALKGLSNIHESDTMMLEMAGLMANQAAMKLKMTFPLSTNEFHADAAVGPFDMRIWNSMIKNLAPVQIDSGNARNMTLSCTANETAGYGQMIFKFSDLRVKSLDKNDNERNYDLLGGVKILLANAIVVNNNPDDQTLRVGRIEYTRHPGRSIINYFWNLMFSGIKSSVGLQEEKLKKESL